MRLIEERIPLMLPIALPDRVQKSGDCAGATAHARRVSAWAAFLGKNCGVGAGSVDLLRKAALVHHAPGFEWSSHSMQRLMEEVVPELAAPPSASSIAMSSPPHWELLFRELSRGRYEPHRHDLLCRIAEIAYAFDELLEFCPMNPRPGAISSQNLSLFSLTVNRPRFSHNSPAAFLYSDGTSPRLPNASQFPKLQPRNYGASLPLRTRELACLRA